MISNKTYRIVFYGEIREGLDIEAVKAGLAKNLNLSPDAAEKLFSRKSVVIKENADEETAKKLHASFTKAGAKLKITKHPQPKKTVHPSTEKPGLPENRKPAKIPLSGNDHTRRSSQAGTSDSASVSGKSLKEKKTAPPSTNSNGPSPSPSGQEAQKAVFEEKANYNTPRQTCPKCGLVQEKKGECKRCGFVFKSASRADKSDLTDQIPLSSSASVGTEEFAKEEKKSLTRFFPVILFLALILYIGYNWWTNQPVSYGPGMHAPDPPEQVRLFDQASIEKEGFRIEPLATFRIKARVLSKKEYSSGKEAELSPVDLALGWGKMSDERILEKIEITQSGRWYHWKVESFPIPRRTIETHSANMHIIPVDDDVNDVLRDIRKGHLISIKGKLVRITSADGRWTWTSSTTRDDTGAGACEIIWAEKMEILPVPRKTKE